MTLAKIKTKLAAKKRAALEAVQLVTRRVRLCGWGQVYHEAIDFTVDRSFIADLSAYLDWCRARGHRPPILRQHREDGTSWGVVAGLEARDDGPWLVLAMHPQIAADYDAGRLPYWSPHFEWGFADPHRAAEDDPSKPYIWPVRLREMSFVSVPHLLNNEPANVTLSGSTTTKSARVMCAAPQREDKKMELTPEEITALKALAVAAPKLTALVEDSETDDVPPVAPMATQPAPPTEEPPADTAMAAMSASVANLTSKVTTLGDENKQLKAALAAQAKESAEAKVAAEIAGLTLTDDERQTLVALKMSADKTSQAAYALALKGHRAAAMASGGTTEIGVVGSAAGLSSVARGKFATLASKVKEAKIDHNDNAAMAILRAAGIKPSELTEDDWKAWDAANS